MNIPGLSLDVRRHVMKPANIGSIFTNRWGVVFGGDGERHACKVRYAVRHLLRTGSTYRNSASETPAWVRGSRERFNGRRAQARAALGA